MINQPAHAPQSSVNLENIRLLVVEADLSARTDMVSALQSCGADVVAVHSMQTGLEAVDQQHLDLVISDLALPDGDGYSLMHSVRQQEHQENRMAVPAIAVSSSTKAIDLERVIAAGFKRYIATPIHPERLVVLVAKLVHRLQMT